jgi:hypothetical protein
MTSSLYYSGDTRTNRGTSLRRPWDARRRAQIRSDVLRQAAEDLVNEQAQVEQYDPLYCNIGVVGISSVAPSVSATSSSPPSSSTDRSSCGGKASKGVSVGRLFAWRTRSFDGMVVASFPCCSYAAGLCLSSHDGRKGRIGLSFVVG